MALVSTPPANAVELLDALEQLSVVAVALTARALATVEGSEDLTTVQWRALVIADADDGLRVGAVAHRLAMSLPSTSRLVRRLERRGLVTLDPDPTDGRAALVRATPAGSAFRTAVTRRRQELLAEALSAILPTVDVAVAPTIHSIAAAIDRYVSGADPPASSSPSPTA